MELSDISLKDFRHMMFRKDYTLVGGEEAWNILYTEYIDLSGAADTREVTLLRAIHNIEVRLSVIGTMISLQVKWFEEFDKPFFPAFKDLSGFGHNLKWSEEAPDKESFFKQLKRVEQKEKRFIAEKDSLVREYSKVVKNKPVDHKFEEKDFLKLIDVIEKYRKYHIDEDKTNAKRFAIMVKDYNDYLEHERNKA